MYGRRVLRTFVTLVGSFLVTGHCAWTDHSLPRLPVAIGETAGAVVDGHACVFGGRLTTGVSAKTWCTSGNSSDWAEMSPDRIARSGLAAAVVGTTRSVAVVAGGMLGSGVSTSYVSQFDRTSDSWTALPPMLFARNGLGLISFDSQGKWGLLALGGFHANGSTSHLDGHLTVVEMLNLAQSPPEWTVRSPMRTPRSGFGSGIITTETKTLVVVAGGATKGHMALQAVEAYDLVNDFWFDLAPMVRQRTYLAFEIFRDHPNVGEATLMAFGGTNCSRSVRVNGTSRCVSMPSSESLVVNLTLVNSLQWHLLTNGQMTFPVHAAANMLVSHSACVIGGELDSNVYTTATQCWQSDLSCD